MTGPGIPTREDVERLFDADNHRRREWWCLVHFPGHWRLVFDPPSPPPPGTPAVR
ncbi:hypothetical protein SEA_KNOCKER_79 [Mycobacterium phage Knocker]|nr:hypothetical protein SEA_KNOCKER_79 [Mycobacterium phage Knocker]